MNLPNEQATPDMGANDNGGQGADQGGDDKVGAALDALDKAVGDVRAAVQGEEQAEPEAGAEGGAPDLAAMMGPRKTNMAGYMGK
jgi:hypothetical protein